MAFDLKEPWGTHRKYQVFEDKHADLFGRPDVTADRIAMCQIIREEIDKEAPKITNSLFGKYVLTRYLMMYIVRQILEEDELGKQILASPETFVREEKKRNAFRQSIQGLMKDIVIDLNAEVKPYGDDFDYRGRLRDEQWIKTLTKTIVSDYLKQVARDRIPSLKQDWESKQ